MTTQAATVARADVHRELHRRWIALLNDPKKAMDEREHRAVQDAWAAHERNLQRRMP